MRLAVDNDHSILYGASHSLTKSIDRITSYRVKDAEFTPSFRNGFWDGRIQLLSRVKDGGLKFPTGLLRDVLKVVENFGAGSPEILDRRRTLGPQKNLPWNSDIKLRGYQKEAVDLAIGDPEDLTSGRGILKLPIRSGKTVIAAGLIRRLKRQTLFVVTSQLLLHQTVKLFSQIFGEVGAIGDKAFDPRFLTVASVQSLVSTKSEVRRVLHSADLLLVDEVHHMKGDSWRKPILAANARYKIGLSATVTVNRKLSERSAVYLKSATGPILIDVPMSRLVKGGHILPLEILLVDQSRDTTQAEAASYQIGYDLLIVENEIRNELIAATAVELVGQGHKVLIDTGRLKHIKLLYRHVKRLGVNGSMIYGSQAKRVRQRIIENFKSGERPIMIGTVMGEGVDVPELSAVINAEGGKSEIATLQRLRNLTLHPGKKSPILIDFVGDQNRYLRKHSRIREKQYRSESVFTIRDPVLSMDFLRVLRDRAIQG